MTDKSGRLGISPNGVDVDGLDYGNLGTASGYTNSTKRETKAPLSSLVPSQLEKKTGYRTFAGVLTNGVNRQPQTDIEAPEFRLYIEGVQVPFESITLGEAYRQLPTCSIVVPHFPGLNEIARGYYPKVHVFYRDHDFERYLIEKGIEYNLEDILRLKFEGFISGYNYTSSKDIYASGSVTFQCLHKYALLQEVMVGFGARSVEAFVQQGVFDEQVAKSVSFNSPSAIYRSLKGVNYQTFDQFVSQVESDGGLAGLKLSSMTSEESADCDKFDKFDPGWSGDPCIIPSRLASCFARLYGIPGVLFNLWQTLKKDSYQFERYARSMIELYIPLIDDGLRFFGRMSGHVSLEYALVNSKLEVSQETKDKIQNGDSPTTTPPAGSNTAGAGDGTPPPPPVGDAKMKQYAAPKIPRGSGYNYTHVFLATIYPYVKDFATRDGVFHEEFMYTIMAQAANECAWGQNRLVKEGFNIFSLKSGRSGYPADKLGFAIFSSFADCFTYYDKNLRRNFKRALPHIDNPVEYLRALQIDERPKGVGSYCTDPAGEVYVDGIMKTRKGVLARMPMVFKLLGQSGSFKEPTLSFVTDQAVKTAQAQTANTAAVTPTKENQMSGAQTVKSTSTATTSSSDGIIVPPVFQSFVTDAVQADMSFTVMQSILQFASDNSKLLNVFQAYLDNIRYDMQFLSSPIQTRVAKPSYGVEGVDTVVKPVLPYYFSPTCNVFLPSMYSTFSIQEDTYSVPTRITATHDPAAPVGGGPQSLKYRAPHLVRVAYMGVTIQQINDRTANGQDVPPDATGNAANLGSITAAMGEPVAIHEFGRGIRIKQAPLNQWLQFLITKGEKTTEDASGDTTDATPAEAPKTAKEIAKTNEKLPEGANVVTAGADGDATTPKTAQPVSAKTGLTSEEEEMLKKMAAAWDAEFGQSNFRFLNPWAPKAENGLEPYQRTLYANVDYEYGLSLTETRLGQLSGPFNPYAVPGYPCDIIDPSPTRPSYHGFITSISHNISSGGNVTTVVSFSNALSYQEMRAYKLPAILPWLQLQLGFTQGFTLINAGNDAWNKATEYYYNVLGVGFSAPDWLEDPETGEAYEVGINQAGNLIYRAVDGENVLYSPDEDRSKGITANHNYSTSGALQMVRREIETMADVERAYNQHEVGEYRTSLLKAQKNGINFIHLDDRVRWSKTASSAYKVQSSVYGKMNTPRYPGTSVFLDYTQEDE